MFSFGPDDPPKTLVAIIAEIHDGVSETSMLSKQLPPNWRRSLPPSQLAAIGDRFIHEKRAAILIGPWVLVPAESNWLIKPLHPDASKIKLRPAEPFEYDFRFFN